MENEKLEIQEFTRLFETYKEPFIRFAYSYIKDEDAAEDIFMDSMTFYWERRREISENTNISGYILSTIKHKCLNYLRHINIKTDAEAEILEANERIINFRISTLEACDPQELFQAEIQELIRKALEDLPELTRLILTKSRYDNKTNLEISKELEVSVKTVEYHISKALKHIKSVLKDYILSFVIACISMG